MVHGSRSSLVVGLASTLLCAVRGGLVALLSGYVGGKTDLLSQRLMDVMQVPPVLVLVLVMAAALGPSLTNAVIAIPVPVSPRAAHVVRASAQTIRELPCVEAVHALGIRQAGSRSGTSCRTRSG